MAATSVETSLSSLLPTLNGNLPPELTHLATSLLAQSRTRLNLKPNEEIARPYACAEIAYKRLKSRLKLPSTHGRPPVPPRVYAKLLDLLEKGLQAQKVARAEAEAEADGGRGIAESGAPQAQGVSTPRKRVVGETKTASKSARSTPAVTPRKNVAFAGRLSDRRTVLARADQEAPEWVMPLIRRLCTALKTPMLPPHVYTGACVVLQLAGLWPSSDVNEEDDLRTTVSAMTIAIYFMVWTKMQLGKITPEVYVTCCRKAIEVATEMGFENLSKEAVDGWIKKMNDEGWCRGQEWWDSVPENVTDAADAGKDLDEQDLDEQDEVMGSNRKRRRLRQDHEAADDKEGVLLPGLGTMMQDAVDFLSAEKTLNYLEWKKEILEKIKHMRRGKERSLVAR